MAAEKEKEVMIQRVYWLPEIPNILAFIIYRVAPIGVLALFTYATIQTEAWEIFGYRKSYPFIFFGFTSHFGDVVGICIAKSFPFDFAKEEVYCREKWVDELRKIFEDYEAYRYKFPFGLINFRKRTERRKKRDKQYQKEAFAVYLSGSRRGIPPPHSTIERLYILILAMLAGLVNFRFAAAMLPWSEIAFRRWKREDAPLILSFISWYILWFLFRIQFTKRLDWYRQLKFVSDSIKKACKSLDIEKTGDKRTELEWWIEAVLIEDTDSPAMAEERKRLITAPILNHIKR